MGTTYKRSTPDAVIGADEKADTGYSAQALSSATHPEAASYLYPEPGIVAERAPHGGTLLRALMGVGSIALLVLGWWAVAVIGNYPDYILPTPPLVAERLWEMALRGSLFVHIRTTVMEAGLGFLLAAFVGMSLGYFIARSSMLDRVLSPYIAVSQALPVVAIAPLLVIWLNEELARNVVIVALIVFFPILVNTIVGMRGIDRSMLEVARISGANWLQTLFYVELPLAARALLGGMRLGLTLSITGAVVGELVSSTSGLGFLLIEGRGLFDTSRVFVGLVLLATLALLLYTAVSLLEKALITWE
jgi:NitT/TauT family transport system permease protein